MVSAAFQDNPNVMIRETCISKGELADFDMDVWDATTVRFGVWGQWRLGSGFLEVDKSKYDRDDAWTRLQQISKMTPEEFAAEWRKEKGDDTECEGDDEEDSREDDEEDDEEKE